MRFRVGPVGVAGGRADAYRVTFEARDAVSVDAVCDADEATLDAGAERFDAPSGPVGDGYRTVVDE